MIEVAVRRHLGAFMLDVEFALPSAGVTALFGRSGAGKTSLVNAIAGLLRPDSGHVRVDGQTFFDTAAGIDLPIEARGIGYVFQDARLFPHLTVRGNLDYSRRRARRPVTTTFDAAVGLLGLGSLLDRMPHHLSGGERQRVALGRALLAQPRLLLLDEPLAALDAPRKAEVLPYIESLVTAFRVPALFVSHAIDEITRLADRIVILNDGRCAASGPLAEVMSNPAHAPLIGRFQAGAVLDCVVEEHDPEYQLSTLRFADGTLRVPLLDLPTGTAVRARLRARDVAIALTLPADISITNRLAGVVESLTVRERTYVDVGILLGATRIRALVTRESVARLGLVTGTRVWALVKSVALDSRTVGFTRRDRA